MIKNLKKAKHRLNLWLCAFTILGSILAQYAIRFAIEGDWGILIMETFSSFTSFSMAWSLKKKKDYIVILINDREINRQIFEIGKDIC